jgi:phosphoglycerate dehydrogenase-like enzyme
VCGLTSTRGDDQSGLAGSSGSFANTSSPLWSSPRVLVSPHTAALNAAEDRLIAELFADNARRFLDGEELVNRVDTVEFY